MGIQNLQILPHFFISPLIIFQLNLDKFSSPLLIYFFIPKQLFFFVPLIILLQSLLTSFMSRTASPLPAIQSPMHEHSHTLPLPLSLPFYPSLSSSLSIPTPPSLSPFLSLPLSF